MNPRVHSCSIRAMTMIELLVVIGVIGILVAIMLPGLARPRHTASPRTKCVNNLKNIGLAFRIFTTDNEDRFPMRRPIAEGGTKELVTDPTKVWALFAVLSNELSTPKILLCPSDRVSRQEATTFNRFPGTGTSTSLPVIPFSKNAHLSYFLGIDAEETNPRMLLSGDRNLTNLFPTRFAYGLAQVGPLGTNHTTTVGAGWDGNVHQHQGNFAMTDGSVQQLTTARLRDLLRSTGDTNGNRITVPD